MEAILAELRRKFAQIQEADVFVMVPPAIRGLGATGGFQMQVLDRGGVGGRELQAVTDDLVAAAKNEPDPERQDREDKLPRRGAADFRGRGPHQGQDHGYALEHRLQHLAGLHAAPPT